MKTFGGLNVRANYICSLAVAGFLLAGASLAEARKFTSTDGKEINGDLIAVSADSVVIKVGTKNFTVPANRFTLDDQKYIAEWKAKETKNRIPKLDVKVNSGVNNRRDRADSYDDRKGSFNFTIKIENRERGYDLKDATGLLIVLGEDCDDDDNYVVMQLAKMKINAAEGKIAEWAGQEKKYKFDDSYPSTWGYKYYSYIFILKNSSGTVVFKKTSQKKFESVIDEAENLKERDIVDKLLKKRGRASTSYF